MYCATFFYYLGNPLTITPFPHLHTGTPTDEPTKTDETDNNELHKRYTQTGKMWSCKNCGSKRKTVPLGTPRAMETRDESMPTIPIGRAARFKGNGFRPHPPTHSSGGAGPSAPEAAPIVQRADPWRPLATRRTFTFSRETTPATTTISRGTRQFQGTMYRLVRHNPDFHGECWIALESGIYYNLSNYDTTRTRPPPSTLVLAHGAEHINSSWSIDTDGNICKLPDQPRPEASLSPDQPRPEASHIPDLPRPTATPSATATSQSPDTATSQSPDQPRPEASQIPDLPKPMATPSATATSQAPDPTRPEVAPATPGSDQPTREFYGTLYDLIQINPAFNGNAWIARPGHNQFVSIRTGEIQRWRPAEPALVLSHLQAARRSTWHVTHNGTIVKPVPSAPRIQNATPVPEVMEVVTPFSDEAAHPPEPSPEPSATPLRLRKGQRISHIEPRPSTAPTTPTGTETSNSTSDSTSTRSRSPLESRTSSPSRPDTPTSAFSGVTNVTSRSEPRQLPPDNRPMPIEAVRTWAEHFERQDAIFNAVGNSITNELDNTTGRVPQPDQPAETPQQEEIRLTTEIEERIVRIEEQRALLQVPHNPQPHLPQQQSTNDLPSRDHQTTTNNAEIATSRPINQERPTSLVPAPTTNLTTNPPHLPVNTTQTTGSPGDDITPPQDQNPNPSTPASAIAQPTSTTQNSDVSHHRRPASPAHSEMSIQFVYSGNPHITIPKPPSPTPSTSSVMFVGETGAPGHNLPFPVLPRSYPPIQLRGERPKTPEYQPTTASISDATHDFQLPQPIPSAQEHQPTQTHTAHPHAATDACFKTPATARPKPAPQQPLPDQATPAWNAPSTSGWVPHQTHNPTGLIGTVLTSRNRRVLCPYCTRNVKQPFTVERLKEHMKRAHPNKTRDSTGANATPHQNTLTRHTARREPTPRPRVRPPSPHRTNATGGRATHRHHRPSPTRHTRHRNDEPRRPASSQTQTRQGRNTQTHHSRPRPD